MAERVRAGEDFFVAVRELLDELSLRPPELVAQAIADRPPPTGDRRYDAYLGAVAEHVAFQHGLARPSWACEPERFCDRMWFPSPVPGFRAMALAESPAAFRRRGIFISARSLERC